MAAIKEAASRKKQPPTEKAVQRRIREKLNDLPRTKCLQYKGGQGGIKGHSDLYGCQDGKAFYIEVKREHGGKYGVTAAQEQFLSDMKKAGAIVGVATNFKEAVAVLEGRYQWPNADFPVKHSK